MTREEALEDIILYLNANEPKGLYCENIEVIKQELKALEIIKKKNVNIGLVNVLGSVKQYNQTYVYDNMLNVKWCLTQEEFDLLKGILNDEQ